MNNPDEIETIAALQQRIAELEQREERFRLVVESGRDGMWDWNIVTGEVYYSPRWLEVLGYQPAEIEPNVSTWEKLLHPDDIPHVMAALQRHLSDQTASYEAEFRLKTRSGCWLWVLDRGKVVARDAQGQPLRMIGSFVDISERKQAEQVAHQQNAELQQQMSAQAGELHRAYAALNQSADAIYWLDQDRRFIYVNAAACTMLGYSREELLEMTVNEIDPQITREEVAKLMQSLAQDGKAMLETVHRRKDGSLFPVEVLVGRVMLDDAIFTCSFARDISERKRAEEKARLAQFALDHAVDNIQWITSDGSIVYVNDATCEALGYTREELLSMRIFDIDPFFTEAHIGPVWEDLKQHGMQRFEAVHRAKDGRDIAVEIVSNYLEFEGRGYACTSARDISERKRTEYELRLAKFALDRSVDIIHWLGPNAEILYVNDAACAALGYTREEMLQKRIFDIDPEFPEEAWAPMWSGLKERGFVTLETVHRHHDGHIIPIEVRGNYMEFEGREYSCVFSRDISERKQMEAERQELQQQIIDAQQVAIRELSTPLLPITANAIALPLIGTIDSRRAQQVMETLLEGIASYHANTVLIDITGVQVVDTQVAQALLQTAQAARLLGAQVILTGIQPQIAQTLVQLGADLGGMVTRSTLQAGIADIIRNTIHLATESGRTTARKGVAI